MPLDKENKMRAKTSLLFKTGHRDLPDPLEKESLSKDTLQKMSRFVSSKLQGIYRALDNKPGKPTDNVDASIKNGKLK